MKQAELMRDAVKQLGGSVTADEAFELFEACKLVPDTVSVVADGVQYSEPELRLIAWLEDVAPLWFTSLPELIQAYGWACANPHSEPPTKRREAYRLVSRYMHETKLTTSQVVLIVSAATGIAIPYPESESFIKECAEPWMSDVARKTLSQIRREANVVSAQAVQLSAVISVLKAKRNRPKE